MAAKDKPAFWVNPYSDPVIIKIRGRAGFQNASPISLFLQTMLREGKLDFVFDLEQCSGMDSTFLGILAGIAIEVRKTRPRGHVVLCRLSTRNAELVRNLGLHRILTLDEEGTVELPEKPREVLDDTASSGEVEKARLALKAHENLIEVNESNRGRFQDVVSFLKSRIDQG